MILFNKFNKFSSFYNLLKLYRVFSLFAGFSNFFLKKRPTPNYILFVYYKYICYNPFLREEIKILKIKYHETDFKREIIKYEFDEYFLQIIEDGNRIINYSFQEFYKNEQLYHKLIIIYSKEITNFKEQLNLALRFPDFWVIIKDNEK